MSEAQPRLSSAEELPEDLAQDPALRPKSFADFIGQKEAIEHLEIFIAAARHRGEPLDHTLFTGPPGLGKTTLAQIIANELGFEFHSASAPAIGKPGEIVALLLALEPGSVLFIDEIHRLNKTAAELLYTAMEDRRISIVIGDGASARNHVETLNPFTLVGATTRPGMLPGPLMHRFGIQCHLEYYDPEDLERIVARTAGLMRVDGDPDAYAEIARRARGTPRIAKRLLRRVHDFALAEGRRVDLALAQSSLARLGIEEDGLDRQDRRYLEKLARAFRGGPVGIETLAASLAQDPDILEVSIEPFLMKLGLIQRTLRGRILTEEGFLRVSGGKGPPPALPLASSGPEPVQTALDL